MSLSVVVGSAFVAKYPEGGGSAWVPLQYLRGFRDLGCEACWLEVLESSGDEAVDRTFIETFLLRAEELGIAGWVALAFYPDGVGAPDHRQVHGMDARELDARCRDGLLLNLTGSLNEALRAPFARTILFDIDPGLFQIWASQWGMGVGRHDVHLTIGQHLGAPDCPIPLCGVEWVKTWPAVHLPSWPVVDRPGEAYTTVTQWWSPESATFEGELYECSKREGFARVLDLPRRVPAPLELAANIHPVERDEIALFTSHGWRLVAPEAEVGTPQQFRRYVQRSRGEFSCAKPAYVKGRTGWLSDRSVCYLASGLPCVLEDTRAAAHLPSSLALQFFSNEREAAEALLAVERDFPRARREARALAEELFSTHVLLPQILRAAGA